MKRAIISVGLVVLMIIESANALESKTFNSDGDIISGEQWDSVHLYDTPPAHTTVNMTGGTVFSMYTYDASILKMSGDRIYNLDSFEFSTVNISGGLFDGLIARDSSFVTFSGTAEVLMSTSIHQTARLDISGGNIDILNVYDDGIINIYAGDITSIWAQDNTIVNVFGHHDLMKTSSGGMYGHGIVQGYYNDLSWFRFDLENVEAYSHINLIPEPMTLLMLGLGGICLRKKG